MTKSYQNEWIYDAYVLKRPNFNTFFLLAMMY